MVVKKHSARCENANPLGECKCKCGGKYHGTQHALVLKDKSKHIRSINARLGGEVGDVINTLSDKRFMCTCGKLAILDNFSAYPHDGGLADAEDKKWWLLYVCSKCDHQWSWDKIIQKLKRQKTLTEGLG